MSDPTQRPVSPDDVVDATPTHCPYCALQCGMLVRPGARAAASRGRGAAVTVTPNPRFPVNRGQMCIKGYTSAELLDHPRRIERPMLRRRDGSLEAVSWDLAIDFIAGRVRQIQERHGHDAVAAFGSGALTNEKTYLLAKFVRVVLRTANIDYNGRYCMSSAAVGQTRAFGIDRGLPFPVADLAETQTLVLWGSNCAETMPPLMQWVQAQRERGGALVVVDPRVTDTARGASLHLAPTPGSDLALANGLLHLAIEERLIDEHYIAARTTGWDEVRRSVLLVPLDHVERLTGIPIEHQLRAVRMLAAGPSMVLSGRGAEQQSKGADTVSALINLMLALGKVGKPASGYGCITGQGNGQGGREHGQKADQLPGYRLIEDPQHRAAMAAFWGVEEASLPRKGKSAYELLESLGERGGARALLVFGSNVAVASPNARRIEERLRALDLLVVCDSFENETARAAHVILPTTQWAEETGTMTNLEGRVILRQAVQAAPGEVRSDVEILCRLAARMGYEDKFRFQSSEDVFRELAAATRGGRADYSGMSYSRIRSAQGLFWPCPKLDDGTHPGTPRLFAERFAHEDGRARFVVVKHRPAAELPDAEYPLYFTTGRYKEHYNTGAQTRRVAPLLEARPEPKVQLHPRLAARLGVAEGGQLMVESRRGSVTFLASISADIRADTLFAPFHWGGQQAANTLTVPALDPASRMPEFKVCAVRARAL